MPAMKRPASALQAPKKSPKVEKPTASPVVDHFALKCDLVADALLSDSGKATQMLVSMLPFAAAAPPRHKFQEGTLDLVQKELDCQAEAIKASLAKSHSLVTDADGERNRRTAAAAAATAALEQRTSAHAAAKAAEASAKSEVKAAREAVAVARAEQKDGDAELTAASEKLQILIASTEEKAALEKAEDPQDVLKPRAEQLHASLSKVLEDVGLRNAALKALSKPTTDRAMFDQMVIKQISEELSKNQASLEKIISDAGPGKAARDAKVAGCETTLHALLDKQATAEMEESTLAVELINAKSALKDTTDAVNGLSAELDAATAEIHSAEWRLSEFQRTVLQTFADLRDPAAAAEREAKAAAEARAALDAELDRQVALMNAEAEAAAAKKAAEEAAAAEKAAAEEAAAAEKAAAEQAAAEQAAAEAAAAAEKAAAEQVAAEAAAAEKAAKEQAAAEAASAAAATEAAAAQAAAAQAAAVQAVATQPA